MKNNNSKINNGCLNIFKFLMLLHNDEAYYMNVYNIFKNDIIEDYEGCDDKKLNNLIQVVINKYTNALKIFGIKIHKENHKYKLDSSLYALNYTINDLKALSLLLYANDNIPDDDIHKHIAELKENLLIRMNSTDKNNLNTMISNKNLSFFYTGLKEQIAQCKKYCRDNCILNITYLFKNKEFSRKCSPKEVTYDTKNAYLNVYDIVKKENLEIPLPNILNIEVMPSSIPAYNGTTTVVYKLKGRLAKTYKLKETEKLESKTDDELIIINNGEPIDKLYSRLMRYADLCEILTPKYIRNEMINLLSETLKLYKDK